MQIIDAAQGGQEWMELRAKHFTASEAPAMLGLSKYKTREALLREKHTGMAEEIDANKQRLFDRGHEAEAAARPNVESLLMEDLFPTTGAAEIDGLPLLASFDGLNMDETVVWENKLTSAAVEAMIETGDLDGTYWPQVEQQLLVSGAQRAIFTGSSEAGEVKGQMWYESQPERRAQLIAGWKQFATDLAAYVPQEVIPAAVSAPIKDLPAIIITSEGSLAVKTNFETWGKSLREFISKTPEKPSTDQEFADCKAAVAALKKAEEMLDAEEARVLSAIPDVDEMKRDKKLLFELSSTTRLALEKLVVQRDKDVKLEIVQAGKDKLSAHLTALTNRIGMPMPGIVADFAGAIKSKRSYDKMREAVADLIATKKIESNEIADKIDAALKLLDAFKEYAFLFNDRASIVLKDSSDLALLVKSRIDAHKAAEAAKEEATRQRIRAEEEARAAAKVKAEQEAAERQHKTESAIESLAQINANNASAAATLAQMKLERKDHMSAAQCEPAPRPAAQAVQAPTGGRSQEPAAVAVISVYGQLIDFLDDFSADELRQVLRFAEQIKLDRSSGAQLFPGLKAESLSEQI